jgi:hypothetical protein
LAGVAKELAIAHPDRADRLIVDAERYASTDVWALGQIAEAVAVTDPDRGERIARSIKDTFWIETALLRVVNAVAEIKPNRAERIARSLTLSRFQEPAWGAVVENIAARDGLENAEHLARFAPDNYAKARSLIGAAKAQLAQIKIG